MKLKILFLGCVLVSNAFSFSWDIPVIVDYLNTMNSYAYFNIKKARKDPIWIQFDYLYNKWIVNAQSFEELRIPKIIHQIWIGSPFPEKYRKFQQTWIDNHPDWTYILWTEKELDEFEMQRREVYEATTNFGGKADIARYEILYQLGGLYVDTDFECLKSFDSLHHLCEFYCSMPQGYPLYAIFQGLIGVAPQHPILKRCLDDLQMPVKADEDKGSIDCAMYCRTGPPFFKKCVLTELSNFGDVPWIIFPSSYFYPWPHYERFKNSRKHIEAYFKPESLAVHHWHVSWKTDL